MSTETPAAGAAPRRLIVHIGMPRAGSSTLQEVLFHYRERLEPQGLLYPVLSLAEAGTADRSQIYNHKLLHQSARNVLSPLRFRRFHDSIARQIAVSAAPQALLSYEAWWDPRSMPALRKTITFLERQVSGLAPVITAIVREPATFLLSLYKLDVLHGRTSETFADYWPRKLSDPRLRYGQIAAALVKSFAEVKMLDFELMSRDGRLVANTLASVGLARILRQAGVPSLEGHRSKGGAVFADAPVSMMLFAANRIGLPGVQAKRDLLLGRIMDLVQRADLRSACSALVIPLAPEACQAIATSTAAELAAFSRITGLELPPGRPGVGEQQSTIEAASPLGKALISELDRLA